MSDDDIIRRGDAKQAMTDLPVFSQNDSDAVSAKAVSVIHRATIAIAALPAITKDTPLVLRYVQKVASGHEAFQAPPYQRPNLTHLTDARPFADVLRDWMAARGLTEYRAAKMLGCKSQKTIAQWLGGGTATYETALRALMTLYDEGRITPHSP